MRQHDQESGRNRKLAKKSVRDRYSLEKLLEKAQADEVANASELDMTAKEAQDAGKQDSNTDVNRAKAAKYSNKNASRSRYEGDGKAQEKSRGGKRGGKRTCGRCGLEHEPKKCPAIKKTCGKGLKKNNFALTCRSDKVLAEKVNQVDDSSDEEDPDDEYVKKNNNRMDEYRYWKEHFCETSLKLCESPNSYRLWCECKHYGQRKVSENSRKVQGKTPVREIQS